MPKIKSDTSRLKEKRCTGHGAEYVPWIKANEARSIATASIIRDPIIERGVHVLSEGEKNLFWILRFDTGVVEIREQFALLQQDRIAQICKKIKGYRFPRNILTTDFLVDYSDGSQKAYSVKYSRDEFNKNTKDPKTYEALISRQFLEKRYWEEQGVGFELIFSKEINSELAENISNVMMFYDRKEVYDDATLFMHFVAHHYIEVPMDKIINFSELLKDPKYLALFLEAKSYG